MGQVAKALGAGSTIEFRGETYKLSPWSYAIQSQFEEYLEDHALKVVRRLARSLPEAEAQVLMKQTVRDVSSGVYTFGGEAVQEALKSVPHLIHLTWLMLKANHPRVPKALVEDMYREELERVLEAVTLANADPSSPTPEGQTGAPEQGQTAASPSALTDSLQSSLASPTT
ncbi:MAG TPA: hypothetical protein VEI97_09145 [bacterium]|nr:hypothetical protein [bacterium]